MQSCSNVASLVLLPQQESSSIYNISTRAQRPRFTQWELRNSRGSKIGPQDALGDAAEVVVWRYLYSHRLHEVLRSPPVHDDAQHQWTADAQCKQQPLQGRHFPALKQKEVDLRLQLQLVVFFVDDKLAEYFMPPRGLLRMRTLVVFPRKKNGSRTGGIVCWLRRPEPGGDEWDGTAAGMVLDQAQIL